ncbi:3592_t:CDS:2 [Ambispora leptoticha]|uniref:3592_t:CDS:1 n=1 Tax=Ambispora leptoticha TaxID=144679 RepID=A0A9N9FUC9_9GLOM|nr:3592_t:CDS:2 [Ambispora leptoticha]
MFKSCREKDFDLIILALAYFYDSVEIPEDPGALLQGEFQSVCDISDSLIELDILLKM